VIGTIPKAALYFGLAGLLPFFWGVLTLFNGDLALWTIAVIGPRFVGPFVQLFYGAIILSFMSGVLWGFSTKQKDPSAPIGYGLSVLPVLWVFFTTGGGHVESGINLIIGFLGLLFLDWYFWKNRLAPQWWMKLRVLLTGIVVLLLSAGVF
jgi:hypothetical protein